MLYKCFIHILLLILFFSFIVAFLNKKVFVKMTFSSIDMFLQFFFLILSRFDYCNSSCYGLPETTLHPFVKVFNSASRLVCGTHNFSHLTSTLIYLHWLPLNERSLFEICTLTFKIKNNHSLNYLADLVKLPPCKGLRSFTYSHF